MELNLLPFGHITNIRDITAQPVTAMTLIDGLFKRLQENNSKAYHKETIVTTTIRVISS